MVADLGFRDQDLKAHLEVLKDTSKAIISWSEARRSKVDGIPCVESGSLVLTL